MNCRRDGRPIQRGFANWGGTGAAILKATAEFLSAMLVTSCAQLATQPVDSITVDTLREKHAEFDRRSVVAKGYFCGIDGWRFEVALFATIEACRAGDVKRAVSLLIKPDEDESRWLDVLSALQRRARGQEVLVNGVYFGDPTTTLTDSPFDALQIEAHRIIDNGTTLFQRKPSDRAKK